MKGERVKHLRIEILVRSFGIVAQMLNPYFFLKILSVFQNLFITRCHRLNLLAILKREILSEDRLCHSLRNRQYGN